MNQRINGSFTISAYFGPEQNMNLSTSLKINQTVPTGNNTGQLITLRPELYDPTSQAVCEEDKWHANFNADDSEERRFGTFHFLAAVFDLEESMRTCKGKAVNNALPLSSFIRLLQVMLKWTCCN
ncbi:hypothetical protein DINM_000222 [Dirofilaria immitis]|nr:hypothetical protein [Dirofilaria immitis]